MRFYKIFSAISALSVVGKMLFSVESHDGFIIAAFVTSRTGYLDRRKQLWP